MGVCDTWHCSPSSSRAILNHSMRQPLSPEPLLAPFSAWRSRAGSEERLLPEGNDRAPNWGHRGRGGGTGLLPSRFHSRPHSNPMLPWADGRVSRGRVPAPPEHQHPGASRS